MVTASSGKRAPSLRLGGYLGVAGGVVGLLGLLGYVGLLAVRGGLYGSAIGLTLFALANVVTLSILGVMAARRIAQGDRICAAAEAEVRAARETLDRRVEERTRDLERSEELHRALMRSLPNSSVVVFDDKLDCLLAEGEVLERNFGSSIRGRNMLDVVFPPNRDVIERACRDALAGHTTTASVSRDGYDYLTTVAPLRSDEGLVVAGLSVAFDVTPLRRAENALADAMTQLRAILESANHSIIATNKDGVISEFNPAAERMLGFARSTVVNRLMPGLFHDPIEVRDRAAALTRELGTKIEAGFDAFVAKAARGIADENEWTYIRSDGTRFPVRLSVTALRDSNGLVTGYLGIATDITEAKLAHKELVRARDHAEQAMHARSDFLARMSHEIRTPLNGMIGMTDLALETSLSKEQRDYVETARSSAVGLRGIIDDILDFTKIDAGKLSLEQIPFDVRATIAHPLRPLGERATSKGIELHLRVSPAVPARVSGDPLRIQQIVTNLVSNAIKFTDRGEVVVHVGARTDEAGRKLLEIAVSDTGLGIAPEKRNAVFEAFTQAEEGTTRKAGGTGLGLAICSQLAAMMGGTLDLESSLGQGSSFRFAFPAEAAVETDARGPSQRLDGLRVLIVTDNQSQRDILLELFESWRMCPVSATGRGAAAASMEAHEGGAPFDLVILDSAATLSSERWLMTLRDRRGAYAPIIVLANRSFAPQGPLGRASAFVPKPVIASTLLESVEALIGDVRRTDVPPSLRGAALIGGAAAAATDHLGLEVLVAEDNHVNQRVVRALLERAGHTVTIVEDGRAALAALAKHEYDVVLMDVQMPEMDGLDATRRLRELEVRDGRHVPVIALTAQAMNGDRERCRDAGMDAYVTKPIDRGILLGAIRELTASSATAPPSKVRPPAPVTSAPASPAFDLDEMLARLDGDRELAVELVGIFREDVKRIVCEVRVQASSYNSHGASRAAHALKGALVTMAAGPAAIVAREVEQRAAAGEAEGLLADVTRLEAEIRRLDEELARAFPPLPTEASSRTGRPPILEQPS